MIRSLARAAAGVLALGLLAGDTVPASPRDEPSGREVIARTRRYVADYRPRLAGLVAEEEYRQEETGRPGGARVLVSDFAVVRADDGMWVGFRDVWRVDGVDLPDRDARSALLFGAGRPDWASARQIMEESARFNIGGRVRDFNTPIAPLELLSESRSWCCRVRARPVDGRRRHEAWVVDLEETVRPTLIRTIDGGAAYARLQAIVDGTSGVVSRVELTVGRPHPISLVVTFAPDAALAMWLPQELTERFRLPGASTEGRARYSRWRRFEATSRIVG